MTSLRDLTTNNRLYWSCLICRPRSTLYRPCPAHKHDAACGHYDTRSILHFGGSGPVYQTERSPCPSLEPLPTHSHWSQVSHTVPFSDRCFSAHILRTRKWRCPCSRLGISSIFADDMQLYITFSSAWGGPCHYSTSWGCVAEKRKTGLLYISSNSTIIKRWSWKAVLPTLIQHLDAYRIKTDEEYTSVCQISPGISGCVFRCHSTGPTTSSKCVDSVYTITWRTSPMHVRNVLTQKATETLKHAFVATRLYIDYYNGLMCGLFSS